GSGHVRAIATLDHDPDDSPPPERYPHALTGRDVRLLRRCAVVERPPQRRVDGDDEDHVATRSMHKNCGQVCAWAGVNGCKCRIGREIVTLITNYARPSGRDLITIHRADELQANEL